MREKKSTCVVFGFGTATLDFRIHVADLGEKYKGKLLARESNILGGGAIANCLVQVARLNGRACWLGKLGVDWLAKEILTLLDKEGVDVSKVLSDSTLCSPFNLAVYTEGSHRRIGGFLLPNSLAELKVEDIEVMVNHICENDWVITEIGEIPLDTTLSFCKSTVNKGACFWQNKNTQNGHEKCRGENAIGRRPKTH